MLSCQNTKPGRWKIALATGGAALLMASAALAARSAVRDRGVTIEQARAWAENASAQMEIPVEVNDLVLAELNRFAGTPDGREFIRDSLLRMPRYESMIRGHLQAYGLPRDLLAVPLIESGYTNRHSPSVGAGLWGFIVKTARNYGLVVNERTDQRLDETKETVAAMRYLKYLHDLFGDWRLALKAYNEGESRVAELIRENGTRDPWALEKASSPERYLAKITAVLILMKNPAALD